MSKWPRKEAEIHGMKAKNEEFCYLRRSESTRVKVLYGHAALAVMSASLLITAAIAVYQGSRNFMLPVAVGGYALLLMLISNAHPIEETLIEYHTPEGELVSSRVIKTKELK